MTSGPLRRRYLVQSRAQARNEIGERKDEYTTKFAIWGESPRDGSAALRADAGALRSEDTLRLRTRFRTDIDIGDRLVDGPAILYIRSALDVDGRRRYLQIVASLTPGGQP